MDKKRNVNKYFKTFVELKHYIYFLAMLFGKL